MDDHHGRKYFIIDMLYIITSTVYINYKLIWWRNMNICSYVEVGTPKYTFGFKGLRMSWQPLQKKKIRGRDITIKSEN